MAYSYNKLWKLLIDKKMNKEALRKAAGVSTNVIARMTGEAPVSMESLSKICKALNCEIGDIVDLNVEDNVNGK
jgi:DNA (cytosine-5)-methyltransferase 1